MSKSKTKKVKLKTTPHEELLKELEYLRAENAYLKKLQALVLRWLGLFPALADNALLD